MRLEYPSLIYETHDSVATVLFNRPERLNAQSYPSKWDLKSALVHAAEDEAVRVVVFRGVGRAFCSGIDLKELSSRNIDERNFDLWEDCLQIIESMDKIAVALIHGYAFGSGVQLAIACDLRISTPTTQFGLPAGREGLLPGLSVWRLAKFVGMGRAKELALLGDPISGAEALRIGLVSKLVPDENREEEFSSWVAKIAALSSQGVRATKRAMNELATMDYASALAAYMDYQRKGLASDDFAEAMSAYRENRAPQWK